MNRALSWGRRSRDVAGGQPPSPPLAGQAGGGRSSCRHWAAGVWSTATRLNTLNLTIPLSETESLIHEPPWFSPGRGWIVVRMTRRAVGDGGFGGFSVR